MFVTHPANAAVHSSARPGAWTGNRVLPRARQHRDTVLALYRFRATTRWGTRTRGSRWRTPTSGGRRRDWIAARRGDGYVALGHRRRRTGRRDGARRERRAAPGRLRPRLGLHRSGGAPPTGRSATSSPRSARRSGPASRSRTAPGTASALALDWDGPFTVDGRPADLDADGRVATPCHVDNPLCRVRAGDPEMTIAIGGLTARDRPAARPEGDGMSAGLDPSQARRATPPLPPADPAALTPAVLAGTGRRVAHRASTMGLTQWFWGEGVVLLGMLPARRRAGRTRAVVRHRLRRRPPPRPRPGATSTTSRPASRAYGCWPRPASHSTNVPASTWSRGSSSTPPARRTARSNTGRAPSGPTPSSWPGCSCSTTAASPAVRTWSPRRDARCSRTPRRSATPGPACTRTARTAARPSRATGAGRTPGPRWPAWSSWRPPPPHLRPPTRVRPLVEEQLLALAARQPDHGVWDVLVDGQPENRGIVETSAAAGIAAAMFRAARLGLAPDPLRESAWRASPACTRTSPATAR